MRISHHHPPDITQEVREATLNALHRSTLNALRNQENGARYWRIEPPMISTQTAR